MQDQLNATRNKMGKHYLHINLVIMYNWFIIPTFIWHLSEIFLFWNFIKYVLYNLNNVTLTFKPYMFIDKKNQCINM